MKKIPVILFLTLVFNACTVSRMDRYPGKPILLFPGNIRGEYRLAANGLKGLFRSSQLDSARIRILDNRIESLNEKGWQPEFSISENEVLSQQENYFFLSKKDPTEPTYWTTTLLQGNGKDILVHPIAAKDGSLVKDPLKDYLVLKLLVRKNKEERIQTIDPKNTALLKAAGNIPDSSKDSILYYQMNEEQLVKYIQKELNKSNGIRFVKVNDVK